MRSPALHLDGGDWIGSEDGRPTSDPVDAGRVGTVGLAPMGGTEQSGIGRHSSSVRLDECTETRRLTIGI